MSSELLLTIGMFGGLVFCIIFGVSLAYALGGSRGHNDLDFIWAGGAYAHRKRGL